MPIYADCDYCPGVERKHLIGHLKRYRFNEKKFCTNCHFKYGLPHKFHEIEDYQIYVDRTDTKEVIKQVEIGLPQCRSSPGIGPEERKEIIEKAKKHDLNGDGFSYLGMPKTPEITPEVQTIIPMTNPDELYTHELDKKVECQFKETHYCDLCKEKNCKEVKVESPKKEDRKTAVANALEATAKILEDQLPDHLKKDITLKLVPKRDPLALAEQMKEEEKKVEQKYDRLVVTAFSYSKEKCLFQKIFPRSDEPNEPKASKTAQSYLYYKEVDFVVIAKMRKD